MWPKFGRLVQNDMPAAVIWSKSKPEVEFQYGGHFFFQTGNSYISLVNLEMKLWLAGRHGRSWVLVYLWHFCTLDIVQVIAQSTAQIHLFPVWINNCPPYWNSTSGFDFNHITVVACLCIRLPNFFQIGPSSVEVWCYIDFQDGHCGAILLPVSDLVKLLSSEGPCLPASHNFISQFTSEI